ncbi:alpha/beta hydrolase [Amycolatopsis mediterranei S699]|uniref:Alpha/beta hydrolase n=2 Tax=Amycolatopsis mediterranei TaxID=33910 RepID=A0A0H3DFB2_AMYMU|nr:alpha/beta fold hydrolase [Amycolatopsis mediterranei]ADJ48902.1 alpha/beta hydrolase [Amycolatopsis mediterranei U32]AEK45850.1 alpha/beta hydrolase [Amycolatopsis mediterranei S699]AFO80610.1 alpha/beta hydrolase [Amycolatopsis mediterranei S699]AGT87738.1 alpha/beta hydrolase [Amycolatopsis mediterranei RB]KDU93981.1 4,5-9,10-diseco-3-hydroxy-5,9,17-trioxoandrosta-1(10),2-diene-4-oate hydrolase [Amycolatopsis mediterranei]
MTSTPVTRNVDGLTFAYHEAGEGEPLLMLHGSGPGVSAWSNFRDNLPVFAERFRTIMPDLPGFGGTDLPELDEVYPRAAAKWIARLMDELGIESAVFVGNSMGGAVAAELAVLAPDRVRRMALMGSGGLSVGIFQAEPSEGFKRLFEFLEEPTRERMIGWVKTMVFDPRRITDALVDERMSNATAEGVLEKTKAIFASMFDPRRQAQYTPLWTKAASVTTPTLLLWGRDDRMLPYDQAHFANRWLPDVELHTFSRCGHWIQIERKSDFERVVIEFLTRKASDLTEETGGTRHGS